jgi:hypothetical protein
MGTDTPPSSSVSSARPAVNSGEKIYFEVPHKRGNMDRVRRSRACSLKVRGEGRPLAAVTLTRLADRPLPSDGRGRVRASLLCPAILPAVFVRRGLGEGGSLAETEALKSSVLIERSGSCGAAGGRLRWDTPLLRPLMGTHARSIDPQFTRPPAAIQLRPVAASTSQYKSVQVNITK